MSFATRISSPGGACALFINVDVHWCEKQGRVNNDMSRFKKRVNSFDSVEFQSCVHWKQNFLSLFQMKESVLKTKQAVYFLVEEQKPLGWPFSTRACFLLSIEAGWKTFPSGRYGDLIRLASGITGSDTSSRLSWCGCSEKRISSAECVEEKGIKATPRCKSLVSVKACVGLQTKWGPSA